MLRAVRDAGAAVLVAPPGSGKTTRVPPALLDVVAGQVLVLQPRRVAARLAARRVAEERGWRVGGEIGWRIRFEDTTGPDTRLVVLTEGLLTRRLQADPFLDGVGAVVLDELHERSADADLALALLAEVRREARPDLAVVAMSATLDAEPVAAFLGGPVIRAEGRAWPVELTWDEAPDPRPLPLRAAEAARAALRVGSGDVLVFLPGAGEIARTAAHLEAVDGLGAEVVPLHGGLDVGAQQRALSRGRGRRVILATNVAETSVTAPGVDAVVDGGLVKVSRFDPALGVERLVLERVCRASADQRAGRAGRTGPGRCHRLWTRGEALAPHLEPELARADLAPVALQLRAWGAAPATFRWFEAPPAAALARADALLEALGALREGRLTALGRTLAALPVHPRLGAVIARGHAEGHLLAAAGAAALASERDPFPDGIPGAAHADDVLARLPHLDRAPAARQARDQLVAVARRHLGPCADRGLPEPEVLVRCLLAGFPDRLGRRVGPRRYRLPIGAAELDHRSVVEDPPLIVAVSLVGADRGERAVHRVALACPVEPSWLPTETVEQVAYDPGRAAVLRRVQERFGEVVVRERIEPAWDADALAAGVGVGGLRVDERAAELIARVELLRGAMPELGLPTVDLAAWLPGWCAGRRTAAELAAIDVHDAILAELGHRGARELDQHAPTAVRAPSGARLRVRYGEGGPTLSARVQALFGVRETPKVAAGRVPLTIELLSPADRPVQVTADLAAFWAGSYQEVRRALRGRYPKHAWPEEPP